MIYAQNYKHGCYHSAILSHEEDLVCLVFDPDKVHDSSSSLSTFLARYEKEGWKPPAPKLKKTAWTWTSDEEKETNRLSIPDIGYITKSKTFCSSSETEPEQPVSRPRRVRKRKTKKVEKKEEKVEKREAKILTVSVGCMTDKIKPLESAERVSVNCAEANKASDVQREKNIFKERLSFELANISFKEKKKEKLIENGVTKAAKYGLVAMGVDLKKKEKADENGVAKAVKYGLVAMGVGLGGYFIYKACTRN